MSDYKDRLEIAKKSYISTDGPGEAGTRLWWTLEQVGHSYTNLDVENLRCECNRDSRVRLINNKIWKKKHIGLFTNEVDASQAYQKKLKEISN